MPTKLEDALTELKADHSTEPVTIQLIELIQTQNERIKNLEFHQLELKTKAAHFEKVQADHDQSIGSLTKTRDETVTKVTALESKPANDSKRVDELEKRVTTVEGAVGSKAFKKAEKAEAEKPATPSLNPFKAALAPTPPVPEFQPSA